MIEKVISTGLMEPGEQKVLRVEWDSPIVCGYFPAVSPSISGVVESVEADAKGIDVYLSVPLSSVTSEITLTCRALIGEWITGTASPITTTWGDISDDAKFALIERHAGTSLSFFSGMLLVDAIKQIEQSTISREKGAQ